LLTAVSAQQFTNEQGEVCNPVMSGFNWAGFDGEWDLFYAPEDGMPIFNISYNGDGTQYYLWLEEDHSWPGQYDSAWVIGLDWYENLYWGWKWGDDLFDYNPNGWHGWQYWDDQSELWLTHTEEPVVSCSVSTEVAALITFPGDGMDGPGIDGASAGTDTVPHLPNDAANVSTNYFSVIVGAAFGAVVVAAAAIAVLVMRSKRTAKPTASTQVGAHHVAELSPTDITMAVADVIPAETQSAEAVVVVEETVSAEK